MEGREDTRGIPSCPSKRLLWVLFFVVSVCHFSASWILYQNCSNIYELLPNKVIRVKWGQKLLKERNLRTARGEKGLNVYGPVDGPLGKYMTIMLCVVRDTRLRQWFRHYNIFFMENIFMFEKIILSILLFFEIIKMIEK